MTSMLSRNKNLLLLGAALALITAVVFLSALGNGFTNWDDQIYVTDNPVIHAINWANIREVLSTFYKDDYRLITVLFSYMLEYRFFQLDPFIYHLDNVILHVLNTLLVFYLVRRLSGKAAVAFITALLFGVHPIHVEAVAWVSERKGVLSGFFFLQAIIFYHVYKQDRRRSFYYLSLAAFVLSLLSKLVAVSLPLVLILLDYLEHRPITKRTIAEKIPYFALSGIFALDTIYMYDTMQQLGSVVPLGPLETGLLVVKNVFGYVLKIAAPVNLSAIYPYPDSVSILSPGFFVPVLALCAVVALAIYSLGRTRLVVFAGLFFLVTLLPVLKIVPFASGGSSMADRYMYIPCIGLFYLFGAGFVGLYSPKKGSSGAVKAVLVLALVAIVALSAVITYKQNKVWKDSETLWKHTLSVYPGAARAHFALGNHYAKQGLDREAVENFREAVRLDPAFVDSHFNLGNAYLRLERYRDAAAEYEVVIGLSVGHTAAHINLGLVYTKLGEYSLALLEYRTAARLDPGNPDIHYYLANTLFRLGQLDEAIAEYEKTVQLDPSRSNIYNNLGIAYARTGNNEEAVRAFRAALDRDPGNERARANLKQALKILEGR